MEDLKRHSWWLGAILMFAVAWGGTQVALQNDREDLARLENAVTKLETVISTIERKDVEYNFRFKSLEEAAARQGLSAEIVSGLAQKVGELSGQVSEFRKNMQDNWRVTRNAEANVVDVASELETVINRPIKLRKDR